MIIINSATTEPIELAEFNDKCFPPKEEFKELYYNEMGSILTPHEIEYTWPTVNVWLSDKCVKNYDLVPIYAVSDYVDIFDDSSEIVRNMVLYSIRDKVSKIKNAPIIMNFTIFIK